MDINGNRSRRPSISKTEPLYSTYFQNKIILWDKMDKGLRFKLKLGEYFSFLQGSTYKNFSNAYAHHVNPEAPKIGLESPFPTLAERCILAKTAQFTNGEVNHKNKNAVIELALAYYKGDPFKKNLKKAMELAQKLEKFLGEDSLPPEINLILADGYAEGYCCKLSNRNQALQYYGRLLNDPSNPFYDKAFAKLITFLKTDAIHASDLGALKTLDPAQKTKIANALNNKPWLNFNTSNLTLLNQSAKAFTLNPDIPNYKKLTRAIDDLEPYINDGRTALSLKSVPFTEEQFEALINRYTSTEHKHHSNKQFVLIALAFQHTQNPKNEERLTQCLQSRNMSFFHNNPELAVIYFCYKNANDPNPFTTKQLKSRAIYYCVENKLLLPTHITTHFKAIDLVLLGHELWKKRKYNQAFKWYQLALEKKPNDTEALANLVDCYLQNKCLIKDLPLSIRAIAKEIQNSSLEQLQLFAQTFDPLSANTEACLKLKIIYTRYPQLFPMGSGNQMHRKSKIPQETTLTPEGKMARFNLNFAYLKLAAIQKAKSQPDAAFINWSQFRHDSSRNQWDSSLQDVEPVTDAEWGPDELDITKNAHPGTYRGRLQIITQRALSQNNEKLKNINTFYNQAMTAQDAKSESGKAEVRKRIASICFYLEDLLMQHDLIADGANAEQLKHKTALMNKIESVILILAEGGEKCADRTITMLDDCEDFIRMNPGTETLGSRYMINVLVNTFKKNAIKATLVDFNFFESMQTALYYGIQFNEVLDLGNKTKSMIFTTYVKQDLTINQAIDKLCTAFTEEDLTGFVSGNDVWKESQKKAYEDFSDYTLKMLNIVQDLENDETFEAISDDHKKMLTDFFGKPINAVRKEYLKGLPSENPRKKQLESAIYIGWAQKWQTAINNFYTEQARKDLIAAGFLISGEELLKRSGEPLPV